MGTLRDYVKEFSTLMLEIPDMSEKDLFFNFMDGLQNWAELELQRRGVQDLATAMAVAEQLVEFKKVESSKPKFSKTGQGKGGGEKNTSSSKEASPQSSEGKNEEHGNKSFKGKFKFRDTGCFICGGKYLARDCPKKKALNAIAAQVEEEEEEEGEPNVGAL